MMAQWVLLLPHCSWCSILGHGVYGAMQWTWCLIQGVLVTWA